MVIGDPPRQQSQQHGISYCSSSIIINATSATAATASIPLIDLTAPQIVNSHNKTNLFIKNITDPIVSDIKDNHFSNYKHDNNNIYISNHPNHIKYSYRLLQLSVDAVANLLPSSTTIKTTIPHSYSLSNNFQKSNKYSFTHDSMKPGVTRPTTTSTSKTTKETSPLHSNRTPPNPLPSLHQFVYKFLSTSKASMKVTQLALFYMYKFANELERIQMIQVDNNQLDSMAYGSFHFYLPTAHSHYTIKQSFGHQHFSNSSFVKSNSLSSSSSSLLKNSKKFIFSSHDTKTSAYSFSLKSDDICSELPCIDGISSQESRISNHHRQRQQRLQYGPTFFKHTTGMPISPSHQLSPVSRCCSHIKFYDTPMSPPSSVIANPFSSYTSLVHSPFQSHPHGQNETLFPETSSWPQIKKHHESHSSPTQQQSQPLPSSHATKRILKMTKQEILIANCGRRVFLGCLMIAYKYQTEPAPSNIAWSKLSQLSYEELGWIERTILIVLDYDLFISRNNFEIWSSWALQGL